MTKQSGSCYEIVNCLRKDQEVLRSALLEVRHRGQPALGRFAEVFLSCSRAEGEIALARALELDETRAEAMAALEEQELAELLLDRARHSAHEEQLTARMSVLTVFLELRRGRMEKVFFPLLRDHLNVAEREELGMRYQETKKRFELEPGFRPVEPESILESQAGRVGYIIAWLLGVPAWLLLMIFLIRGH